MTVSNLERNVFIVSTYLFVNFKYDLPLHLSLWLYALYYLYFSFDILFIYLIITRSKSKYVISVTYVLFSSEFHSGKWSLALKDWKMNPFFQEPGSVLAL